MLKIIEPRNITSSLNMFNKGYHNDYSIVSAAANKYLDNEFTEENNELLAKALEKTLRNWGAGRRAAPQPQTALNIKKALGNLNIQQRLRNLKLSSNLLEIKERKRNIKSGAPVKTIEEYDSMLIDTLNLLSNDMMINNRGITYPMKILLLLTGSIPALDRQVRRGLSNAGVSGLSSPLHLPKETIETNAKKICALPFYIADCFEKNKSAIVEHVKKSNCPNLSKDIGRIFDVLLFMQGSNPDLQTIKFEADLNISWYDI